MVNKFITFVILPLLSAIFIWHPLLDANAEKLFLKDGKTIEANGIWEEGDKYGCFVNGKIVTINKSEVVKIEEFTPPQDNPSAMIQDIIHQSFSEKIIKKYSYSDTNNEITLMLYQPHGEIYENYFTENKISKIFVIEIMRLFYKIQDLEKLNLSLETPNAIFFLNQTMSQTERNYGVSIDLLREYDDNGNIIVGENWRRNVLTKYADKTSRLAFLKKYLNIEKKNNISVRQYSLTVPQKNAVRSAKNYLRLKGFSRSGLITQLSSNYGDSYDVADATVAVDSLDIDWNKQAVRAAKNYLSFKGFSCRGLIRQLSSSAGDRFTKSQATYGARQAGACQ